MKAVDKAFNNLQFAVVYGEELKPISNVTKKKVKIMINEKMNRNEQMLAHDLSYTKTEFEKWNSILVEMLELLEVA